MAGDRRSGQPNEWISRERWLEIGAYGSGFTNELHSRSDGYEDRCSPGENLDAKVDCPVIEFGVGKVDGDVASAALHRCIAGNLPTSVQADVLSRCLDDQRLTKTPFQRGHGKRR